MNFSKAALGAIAIVSGLFFSPIESAKAASFDFEGLPATFLPADTPTPGSVLTDNFISQGVRFGKAGVSAGVAVVEPGFGLSPGTIGNSVVGLDQFGNIPHIITGDIFFNFVLPGTTTAAVTDFLSFTLGDGDVIGADLDVFDIRLYDLTDNLIDTLNVSGLSRFPVSINSPGIHRVEIDFQGDFGYSMDDLAFNTPTETPRESVPEPTSALGVLALGGLGVVSILKRKQKEALRY